MTKSKITSKKEEGKRKLKERDKHKDMTKNEGHKETMGNFK